MAEELRELLIYHFMKGCFLLMGEMRENENRIIRHAQLI